MTTRTLILTDRDFLAVQAFVADEFGMDLAPSKRYLVSNRLAALVESNGCASYAELVLRAKREGGSIRDQFADAITTHETWWFRDGHPFECLADYALPALARNRDRNPLRILSSASSTGQEAYSLAMLCIERRLQHDVRIIGLDLSKPAVLHARAGRYGRISLTRGLSDERRARFFRPDGPRHWKIGQEVKALVSFREHNLLDPIRDLGTFDLVLLRNALIYFSRTARTRVIEHVAAALRPGGYLLLGSAEMLRQPQAFRPHRIGRTMLHERL